MFVKPARLGSSVGIAKVDEGQDLVAALEHAFAHDPRVIVGLGSSSGPVTVRVTWPDGRAEEWAGVEIDRYSTLTEGEGRTP